MLGEVRVDDPGRNVGVACSVQLQSVDLLCGQACGFHYLCADACFRQLQPHQIMMKKTQFALACVFSAMALAVSPCSAQAVDAQRETIAPAFAHRIANVPGKTLTALIVIYAPGAKTPAHRHGQSFVVGYVLEGAIRSKLDNGEERVYRAGESWTEKPGAHHSVSENASTTEPAKLMALLVAKTNAKDLFALDGSKVKK